jgi:glycosyltransferase involved in cell wall biosynthesis
LKLARKEKPDLLYAHWFTPQAITTALVSKFTGIPFIFTTHASDISVLRKVPFAKYLIKWTCRSSRAYTAVSQRTANKLIDFFSEEEWKNVYSRKLMIIPMGVNIHNPSIKSLTLDHIKNKHSINDKPIILFLGRLTEKKGVVYLLEAFSLLPKNLRENLQLVIAGDGQLKKYLIIKAQSLKLNNVIFTGYVHGDEKYGLLSLADFLCLPSIIDSSGDSEGFPVVLMEGLAAGLVILASNVSGGEVILGNKVNSFLFAQKSSEDLKEKLILATKLTSDELMTIKKENKELAIQFSWDTIASNYYHLLKGAASDDF